MSSDYNRIVLRARLSSITNQPAMALMKTDNTTALTSSGVGVIWLTTTGKSESNKANWNTKELQEYSQSWNSKITGIITQFKVDALRKAPNAADTSDFLQSANIDYIRFYRTGDKTVTYHLNDGTQDIFMADSIAAVGVGYRLTGEVPTRTGFEFRGWATRQADAKTETNLLSPSAAIAIVNQNVDLYACWLDKRPSTLGLEFDEDSAILSKIFSDAGAGSYADIHFTADGTVAFQANKDIPALTHPTYAVSFEAKYPDGIPVEYNRCTFRAKLSPLSLSTQNLMCLTADTGRLKGILTESNSPILRFTQNGKVTYNYIEKSGPVQNVSAPLKTAYLNALRTGQKAVSDINDSAFVDYIRFYRTGDKTVTYYLNDGTQTAFKTDTQAAVGTDYRLTGDQPTRDGYTFLGWGLRKDATSTVAAIDITNTSANNLYALWQPNETVPTMIEKTSIRVNGQSGIRFAAKVNLSAKNDEKTEEIGFIVGRKDQLEKKDASLNNLVFGADGPQEKGRTPDGVKYVYGVAYNKQGVNIVYDDNGSKMDGITQGENEAVTCIITGITNVNTSLAVRSYVKYDGLYYYSTAFARSLYEAAQSMRENYDSLSEQEKAKVDEILGTTGGGDNA